MPLVGARNEARKPSRRAFRGMLLSVRPHLPVLVAMSVIANLLMLVGPVFMLQVYDRVLGSRSIPTLVALTLLTIALYAFSAFVDIVRSRMTIRFSALLHEQAGREIFEDSLGAAPGSRGNSDPVADFENLKSFIAGPGPTALLDLPWLPVYMVLITLLHPMLGWLSIAAGLVMIGLLVANEMLSRGPSQVAAGTLLERQKIQEDARANREAMTAMGMRDAISQRWLEAADRLLAVQTRAADQAAFFVSVGRAFRMLLQSLMLAAGAYLVILGQLSPGLMLAISVISSRALAPIEQVVAHWRSFVRARQAFGRLNAEGGEESPEGRLLLPRPKESIVVSGLAAAPSGTQRPLVVDVSFALRAGQGVGIIGPSGSGKSTIARAITGVWPALRGTVRLDGADLSNYQPQILAETVGYLPQDVQLFEGTVAENIARFAPQVDPSAVLEAAKASGTYQLITSLPDGFDTNVGPRGMLLSAGQRQRIGLARAMFGRPFLIVLDEPNSNLDSEGEAALSSAIRKAKADGAVVVVVAHRPSAIAELETLLYVQAGRQVAFGPREEVLRLVTPSDQRPQPATRASHA